jgi:hypothetical protein
MRNVLVIFLFVVILLVLGFLHDSLFVNINAVLFNKYFHPMDTYAHHIKPPFLFLESFSYNALYISKWFITPVFVLAYWFVQRRFLLYLFGEKKATRWLSMLYLSLFLLAGISFAGGWMIGKLDGGYRFSRIFIGLLESPIPCMVLIPLTYFYKKYNVLQTPDRL